MSIESVEFENILSAAKKKQVQEKLSHLTIPVDLPGIDHFHLSLSFNHENTIADVNVESVLGKIEPVQVIRIQHKVRHFFAMRRPNLAKKLLSYIKTLFLGLKPSKTS
jgi:hypothetical protein